MKISLSRIGIWSATAALLAVGGFGCNKAPAPVAPQTLAPSSQITDSRISSIQNNPSMSPDAKQKAIVILKSREAGASAASVK